MKKYNKEIRNITLMVLTFLLILPLFYGFKKKDDPNALNIYNWGDYIDPSVIKQFQKETGIKVNYETFATNEDMYVKIKKGKANYDVVIPSDYMITKMANENMLEKINFKNISNYKYINDEFKNLEFDSKNEYSVPYMWGTVGIIYNSQNIKDKIESFNDLWNPKYKDKILMLDSQRDSVGIALKKLGYSLNTRNIKEIDEARKELEKQKPLVRAYAEDEIKDLMVEGEGDLAIVWSGDAVTMIERNKDLKYVIPKEGSNLWVDSMVIPKGTQHKKEAEMFINFMTRPDISLKNVEYIGYSTPNIKTFEMLDKEIKKDPTSYPDKSILDKCEVFIDLGEFVKHYDRAWIAVKAK